MNVIQILGEPQLMEPLVKVEQSYNSGDEEEGVNKGGLTTRFDPPPNGLR